MLINWYNIYIQYDGPSFKQEIEFLTYPTVLLYWVVSKFRWVWFDVHYIRHSSKQWLLKNSSQWICCRYAWWYTRFQSFNEFFSISFHGKISRVCETQKRMNVSIENLAVAFNTILVLFGHLQSRFTSYFNKKKLSCFKQTILSPNFV